MTTSSKNKRKWKIYKEPCQLALFTIDTRKYPWSLQTPEGGLTMHYKTFTQAVYEMNEANAGRGIPSLMY